MSRVVDRRFVLGEAEKDQFLAFMREYEAFCRVSAVTFSVMSNHFHLLLRVPKPPETTLTDEDLLTHIECLSGTGGGKTARQQLTWFRERGQHDAAEALRNRYLKRMGDLSPFMKALQQRFTQWFNKTHKRRGTLWESRFKSVLVESEGEALAAIAAYIDLNSVRANLVADPMHYRWCGYGQAMVGNRAAQEGLRLVMAGAQRLAPEKLDLGEAMRQYRIHLLVQGEQNEGTDQEGQPLRRGFSPEEVSEVLRRKGRVPLHDYMKLRVRYFVDGGVIGSRAYVNQIFEAFRPRFGPKRRDGARRMRGVKSNNLYVLRDLKRDVIGGVERAAAPGQTTKSAAEARAPSGRTRRRMMKKARRQPRVEVTK